MKPGYKVWLDQNGKAFGEGPCELLSRVEHTHSLHQAAAQMGMAYSKAWCLIRTMEQRLGFILLDRRAGGRLGGGSRLTPEAKVLMKNYILFQKDVKRAIDRIYRQHFCNPKRDISL